MSYTTSPLSKLGLLFSPISNDVTILSVGLQEITIHEYFHNQGFSDLVRNQRGLVNTF